MHWHLERGGWPYGWTAVEEGHSINVKVQVSGPAKRCENTVAGVGRVEWTKAVKKHRRAGDSKYDECEWSATLHKLAVSEGTLKKEQLPNHAHLDIVLAFFRLLA